TFSLPLQHVLGELLDLTGHWVDDKPGESAIAVFCVSPLLRLHGALKLTYPAVRIFEQIEQIVLVSTATKDTGGECSGLVTPFIERRCEGESIAVAQQRRHPHYVQSAII